MEPEPITREPPPLTGRVVAAQRWREATFLHWRVAAREVAPLLPAGVRPDLAADGLTRVGLIAFHLERASIGGIPAPGGLGDFTEVNVRLYAVDDAGRRGVVFLSLEAASLPAVLAARAVFSLPYVWSRTAQRRRGDVIDYAARRIRPPWDAGRADAAVRFGMRVVVDESVEVDDEESRFLTARWALFQRRGGRTRRLANEHEPWVLHPARLEALRDDLLAAAGVPGLADRPPDSVLHSPGVSARFQR